MAMLPETYLDIQAFSPHEFVSGWRLPSALSNHTHEGRAWWVTLPAQMQAGLQATYIDIGILFPDHLLKLPSLTQVDYAAALARALRSAWLVDVAADIAEVEVTQLYRRMPARPAERSAGDRKYGPPRDRDAHICAGLDPALGTSRCTTRSGAVEASDLPNCCCIT